MTSVFFIIMIFSIIVFILLILKRRKSRFLFFYLLVLTITSFVFLSSNRLDIEIFNLYESMMSKNPGFSSSRNILDEGGNVSELSISDRLNTLITNIPKISEHLIKNDADLDKIYIQIKFKQLKKLLKDREEALANGYLDNPTIVKGKIIFRDKEYKAEIRLKGDLKDHWSSKHRMSLRIKLKNGETILGMNSFSIHKPQARQHPYDPVFQSLISDLNLLSIEAKYLDVKFNDKSWGIMNVEEHYSKQFLEKKQRKESLIFRFSDDLYWKNYSKSTRKIYSPYRLSDSKLFGHVYGSKKVLQILDNRKIYSYVMNAKTELEHDYLYSIDEYMKLVFASIIWGDFHVLADANLKYYFNPYTLELSPISSDQGYFSKLDNDWFGQKNSIYPNESLNQALKAFKKYDLHKKKSIANEVIKSFDSSREKFQSFQGIFPLDMKKNISTLEENILLLKKNINEPFKSKIYHDFYNQSEFDTIPNEEQAKDFISHVSVRHFDNGNIAIYNLLPLEVKVDKINIGDSELVFQDLTIPKFEINLYDPFVIKTDFTGILDDRVRVYTSIGHETREHIAQPTILSKDISNPIINTTIELPNFIKQIGPKMYEFEQGDWTIMKSLVIDGDLQINQGTNLAFCEKCYLIVKGSINVAGSTNKPVILEPINKSWKGLYVISKDKRVSKVKDLIIKNTVATSDGILNLTGGVTFYDVTLHVDGLEITNTKAEDAINIINSKIDIKNLVLKETISDALDCDFCTGIIDNGFASDIQGDAIDFSGSNVLVKNFYVENVKDKAFSVGEGSEVTVSNSIIDNVGVGIASKDSSITYAENLEITNFKLAGAMTYTKKDIFLEQSEMRIRNSIIDGEVPYLRQNNTFMSVDEEIIQESILDVENLYSEGVMKK